MSCYISVNLNLQNYGCLVVVAFEQKDTEKHLYDLYQKDLKLSEDLFFLSSDTHIYTNVSTINTCTRLSLSLS